MKVWSVDYIHTPWVGHGFEVLELFSTEALAIAYRDQLIAEGGGQIGEFDGPEGYAVQEWIVDDPRILADLPSAAAREDGEE